MNIRQPHGGPVITPHAVRAGRRTRSPRVAGAPRQGRFLPTRALRLCRRCSSNGVAMLHSFRYAETEKTFREVLVQDPSCAIATWGIAAILMDNPLAAVGPSPERAERAQKAIEQGRRIGAKTQRERDYIEAIAAYYAGLGESARGSPPAGRAPRPSRRSPPAILTMTKHRFFTRCTSPQRSR